jgi:hypothetical protein
MIRNFKLGNFQEILGEFFLLSAFMFGTKHKGQEQKHLLLAKQGSSKFHSLELSRTKKIVLDLHVQHRT